MHKGFIQVNDHADSSLIFLCHLWEQAGPWNLKPEPRCCICHQTMSLNRTLGGASPLRRWKMPPLQPERGDTRRPKGRKRVETDSLLQPPRDREVIQILETEASAGGQLHRLKASCSLQNPRPCHVAFSKCLGQTASRWELASTLTRTQDIATGG